MDSLIQSSFWSFVTITPLMMFVSRSIPAGAIAMLPNILPILVIFGGMGWFGFAVDIGSMMAASIALGVAVDDTIHYMTWFRDDLDRTHDRNSAILAAYRRCATPTTQAALVNGLGLSVFAFSTFMPTRKFGWLMLVILVAGLIAELILTPALLASPLGMFFKPRKRKASPGDEAAVSGAGARGDPRGNHRRGGGPRCRECPAPISYQYGVPQPFPGRDEGREKARARLTFPFPALRTTMNESLTASDPERTVEFEFVRITENAALNVLHWLGRGERRKPTPPPATPSRACSTWSISVARSCWAKASRTLPGCSWATAGNLEARLALFRCGSGPD